MRRTIRRGEHWFMVTRTDNHCGLVLNARGPMGAVRKARRKYRSMRGAAEYKVTLFCPGPAKE
jgi:hypothetical protein